MNKFGLLLLNTILILSLCSCSIFNSDDNVERRLSLYFEVDGISENITGINNRLDTLVINEFKMALTQFNLIGETIELGSSKDIDSFIFSYDQNASAPRLVIDVGLGIGDDITFNGYEMFLAPVPENARIFDEDFFGEEQNYSIIIRGILNDSPFTLRSSAKFDKTILYENSAVTATNESLVLIKSLDLYSVFLDENNSIIDPMQNNNYEKLVENIKEELSIQGYTSNLN